MLSCPSAWSPFCDLWVDSYILVLYCCRKCKVGDPLPGSYHSLIRVEAYLGRASLQGLHRNCMIYLLCLPLDQKFVFPFKYIEGITLICRLSVLSSHYLLPGFLFFLICIFYFIKPQIWPHRSSTKSTCVVCGVSMQQGRNLQWKWWKMSDGMWILQIWVSISCSYLRMWVRLHNLTHLNGS